jgi:elongation factor G
VAIVGHGGAGKTMLAEHMLYTAGAIERLGALESGTTQSDFDPLEVRRQLSVSAGILPLEWQDCKINLIDVPGFPDFVGDLHGVARVVESVILVTEAKRDLDVGFEMAWDVAEAHGLAKCIFVNKLERDNADFEGLMETLHAKYGRKVVGTQIPIGKQSDFCGVLDLLNMKVYKGHDRGKEMEAAPPEYQREAATRREKMTEAAAETDELATKFLEGAPISEQEIEEGLLYGIERGTVVPILIGSAKSGIGVATLLDRICGELPSPVQAPKRIFGGTLTSALTSNEGDGLSTDADAETVAFCFKTTADPFVGKINYVRVFSGSLELDQTYFNVSREFTERVHHLVLPHGRVQEATDSIRAGDIGAIAKLSSTRTGDTLSSERNGIALPEIGFPEPVFRVAIKPNTKGDEDKLGNSLDRLLEEDPTLHYLRDPDTHQEILEGLGDVHLDATIEKLKTKFGVNITTEPARIPYRETVKEHSKAQGRHKRQTGGKGQFGDCWIEIEPLERGEGFRFENRVVGGAIPKSYIPAIEKGIRESMDHGSVAGFPTVDLKVTVYDGSYHDVDSNEQAFKIAGALALRSAASLAHPVILEPLMDLEIEIPDEYVGDVVGDLNGRRGRLAGMAPASSGKTTILCTAPMATTTRYALELRSLTKGRGRFKQRFSHYEELPAPEQEKLAEDFARARASHESER